jgi:ribose transport system permease protein
MVTYLRDAIIYAVGGCGFYFIVVMGLFDFSVGSIIVLSCVMSATLSEHIGYAGLVLAPIICGALLEFINGMLYIKLRIPSMIVTTGMALIYEALAVFATGSVEKIIGPNLRAFGQYPLNLIVAVAAFLLCGFILKYTRVGTYATAIGSNEAVAKNMGINVNLYKVLAFVISGAFFGIMAVLTISYGSSMVAVTGMASMSRNFVPTMGCFFGLAFKKYGMPLPAIIIGEFVINIIFFGFIAMGAPTAIQDVITGLALLIVVTMTTKVTKGEIVK